jgi:hypothetical protein
LVETVSETNQYDGSNVVTRVRLMASHTPVSRAPVPGEGTDVAVQQTTTYKKRLRRLSGLPPEARLVALTIADLRYDARLASYEPLCKSLDDLAAECGMPRRTLIRWMKVCVESGWIECRRVFRDGRQQLNEYMIADPTEVAQEPDYRVPPTALTKEPLPTQPTAESGEATQQGQPEVEGNAAPVPAQPQAARPNASKSKPPSWRDNLPTWCVARRLGARR